MRGGVVVATPRGQLTLFASSGPSEMLAQVGALPPDDGYFYYPFMPTMPFLTARQQISKYDVFTPGYTTPSQYQDACISVLRHADWVIVNELWTDPEFLKHVFPAMQNAQPHETMAFEAVLRSAFTLVAQHGKFELRHRKEGVDESACADVAAAVDTDRDHQAKDRQ
jgi:hypothetical protein